jgi:hypothetical protein
MKYPVLFAALLLSSLALWPAPAAAQNEDMAAMMEAWQKAGQPGMHHKHLAKLVGSWEGETKMWMDPSGEPMVTPATIEYKMIMDGRYLMEMISSEFMGQPFMGHGLYAFNNVTGKVQAIWIDNTATGIYSYEGTINESGDEIVLKGKYIDPLTKESKTGRSVMRLSADVLHVVSYETSGSEEWKMMEITGKRKGS